MKTLQMDSIQVPDILFKKKNLSLLKDVANLFEERSFLEFREGCFTISVLQFLGLRSCAVDIFTKGLSI